MKVIKKNGRTEEFDKTKLKKSITNAGAGKLASKITLLIEKELGKSDLIPSHKIRELVIKHLQEDAGPIANEYAAFEKAVRKIVKREDFLVNRLIQLIGKSGSFNSVYGGFQIAVKDKNAFDFSGVFEELLAAGQSISIESIDGKLVIVSK
ncbi:hypothetical protein HUU53_00605 [Candidatus Micrarchaeota archaeon]|nr:hypothetical protein [Candidatus Micrarchaeota archaeon]